MTSFVYWCALIRVVLQAMEELDDDVPPLEDMSKYLQRAKELQLESHGTAGNSAETQAPKHSHINPVTKPAGATLLEHNSDVDGVRPKKGATFGGLKKGFLFASTNKQGNKKTEREKATKMARPSGVSNPRATTGTKDSSLPEDIPFIKPQVQGTAKGLEFPEVQEAMKEAYPLLRNQDWVTDDLLAKIKAHPLLSRVFQDPQLAQVIAQFQSNPQAAMVATRNNPELREVLQEFCALMGEHFTVLADKEEKQASSKHTPLISEASASAAEEASMRELLQRPAVQEALADPKIQELIETLRTSPERGQQMLRSFNQDLQQKVKVLIDNGLLALQRT